MKRRSKNCSKLVRIRHIKNYSKLVRMCKAHFAKERKETEEHLELIEKTLADPKNKDPRGDYYRYPADSGPYAGNYCDPEHAQRLRSYLKDLPSGEKAWLDRIERADNGGKVTEIHISVDWKKSRTWGSNPTAEVWLTYDGGEKIGGTAYAKSASIGGCGFDKRSAAVSVALSNLNIDAKAALDRLVFEGGEKVWKEYVFDEHPVPHLSFGGKGMSTFTMLFPYIGCGAECRKRYAFPKFVIECDERSDVHDSYHVYLRRKI